MSIRKENLHELINFVSEGDEKLVYDLIKVVIDKDFTVEADNSPLSEREKALLADEDEELIDWDELRG